MAEDRFLRNPDDPRDWNADSGVNKTHTQDRFALKFVRRGEPERRYYLLKKPRQ